MPQLVSGPRLYSRGPFFLLLGLFAS